MFDDFDFRDHPDTTTIDVAGQTLPFFLGRKSFARAKEEGIDAGAIMEKAMDMDDADVLANIDAFASLLWVGLLVFDDVKVSRDELADVLSVRDMQRLQHQITEAFGSVDEENDTTGKAPASGSA